MFLGVLSIIGIIWGICDDKDFLAIICFIIAETCIVSVSLITLYIFNKEIPAIEVYRDNTMMIVTYQDNIPIDSVVVYKP